MNREEAPVQVCAVCGKVFPEQKLASGAVVRNEIAQEIHKTHPDWSAGTFICREDLTQMRGRYVHALPESEQGELSTLEHEVVQSLREHELLSENVDAECEQQWSFGERLPYRIASFGGSWAFLILFGLFLALWVGVNSFVLPWRPLDPYPYIFLNLLLSCLAAIQAPVIMIGQNRQEAKERLVELQELQLEMLSEPDRGK
jgi:uncharacterized membrane protein